MIFVIMTVCHLANPGNCEERRLSFSDVTPIQCMLGSQPYMAQYLNEHPGISIKRFRCETPETAKEPA